MDAARHMRTFASARYCLRTTSQLRVRSRYGRSCGRGRGCRGQMIILATPQLHIYMLGYLVINLRRL